MNFHELQPWDRPMECLCVLPGGNITFLQVIDGHLFAGNDRGLFLIHESGCYETVRPTL